MPPKKPVRQNNKKKKGRGSTADSGSNGPSQAQPAMAAQQRADTIPNFRSNMASRTPPEDDSRGLYGVYKRATQRFKDGLAALVPVEIFARNRVQTMMDAVDYIVENDVSIHPVLLEDCRISLQFCKKYSKNLTEGGDEGHEYIILVLNYCMQSLKPLVPIVKRKASKEEAKQFSFGDLQLSDSDEEEEEDELAVPNKAKSKRPERPVEPTYEYTFQDLIQGTDRLQACAFLDSVERGMEFISNSYRTLKKKMRKMKIDDIPKASCLMEDLMEAAVATNFCIHQVVLMEEELKLDHPHLSTFYRIIACVYLVNITDLMNDVVRACGKSVPKNEMTAFVGDVVENGFRKSQSGVDNLISDFCHNWSLPRDGIAILVNATVKIVQIETQPESIEQHSTLCWLLQLFGVKSHSWIQDKKFIGGDRSILNTHRLVQELSCMLMNMLPTKLILKPGIFGVLWDEHKCLARKIQGDMDQLLVGDILPELLASCRGGALLMKFPNKDKVLPFFHLLQHYVDNPAKPVPLSLSFGVHAILTSIFELQGHNDVTTLGESAKISYNCFFDELQRQYDSKLPNNRKWKSSLKSLMNAKSLPTIVGNAVNERAEYRAFWNPCCAGMFLTSLTYGINMERGADMIDSFAQLRMVLHLYNALEQQNLIGRGIPLLSSLDKYFESVQAVWKGDKPKREQIVKRFWLVCGIRAGVIKQLHEKCRRLVVDSTIYSPHEILQNNRESNLTPVKTEIRAEHFSKSYRRICLGDFSGMVDRYEEHHACIEKMPAWQMNFLVRVNDTLDVMAGKEELLSWNLMAVGGCFNAFIYVLMERLGLNEILGESVASLPNADRRLDGTRVDPRSYLNTYAYKERFALELIFVNFLLGPLEFLESVDHPVLLDARDCLVEYFSKLDPVKYSFFLHN